MVIKTSWYALLTGRYCPIARLANFQACWSLYCLKLSSRSSNMVTFMLTAPTAMLWLWHRLQLSLNLRDGPQGLDFVPSPWRVFYFDSVRSLKAVLASLLSNKWGVVIGRSERMRKRSHSQVIKIEIWNTVSAIYTRHVQQRLSPWRWPLTVKDQAARAKRSVELEDWAVCQGRGEF